MHRRPVGRGGNSIDILMYHSISDAPGPTSIAPRVFCGHLELLAACGYQVLPLTALQPWLAGAATVPDRSVVITFDDGFADFADNAAPALRAHGWTATVFLPSGRMGGAEDWEGANRHPARPLMQWAQVKELAEQGFEFGGHSVTHPALPTLEPADLEHEVRRCRDDLGRMVERIPTTFAPPYGASDQRVRAEIGRWYQLAVGTGLGRATVDSDPFDLPRIEMYYFRNLTRWKAYLEGRADWYLASRRSLRALRHLVVRGGK